MFDRARDAAVRNAAFEWLRAQVDSVGDVLPRSLLARGFTWRGPVAARRAARIAVPRRPGFRPDQHLLEQRYANFLGA